MKIYSNKLRASDIVAALTEAKEAGLVHPSVQFSKIGERGSRKRKFCTEVRLATSSAASTGFLAPEVREFIEGSLDEDTARKVCSAAGRRFSNRGYGEVDPDFNLGATWHEWGHFLAFVFVRDPEAIAGTYDRADSLYWQTYEDPNLIRYASNGVMPSNGRWYNFLGDIEDWEERTGNFNYWS